MLLDIYDPKAPPKAIGIDLGTTNSIVAYVRDGHPVALINCDGQELLPSVVHYADHGQVQVGRTAQSYVSRDPERTIVSVKRFMGKGANDVAGERLGAYRFARPANEDDARVVRFDLGGRTVSPVEVSAEILKSLAGSARDQLRSVGGAVITVPAYFDDAQRQATKDAGKLAGLDVLRLLNEPTAAALAYGLESKNNGLFVVFDLGGGTFDVTVLQLDDGVFQVKSTGGDTALGGDDMDQIIAKRLLASMGYGNGDATQIDVESVPPEVVGLVLGAARDVKHRLTDEERAVIQLPRRDGKGEATCVITRAEFTDAILPLLERAGRACRRALRDAGVQADALDGVILVGGATRVPAVKRYVAELFSQEPLAGIDPDLVVAAGAALHADQLSRSSDEVLLLDVIPLSLGIETMGGAVDRILPRNTTIPAGAKSTFTTYADGQTGFEIHVVQGERELAKDCRSLARFTLRGIPALPAGHARLEIGFGIDENGLLHVSAKELLTGIEQTVEVKPSYGLTDEQVEEMLIDALDHGESDFELRRLVESRVEGERILLATRKALDVDADLLDADQRSRVDSAIRELEQATQSASKPAQIEGAIAALDHATHDWAGARMNRAIKGALGGVAVTAVEKDVQGARGVDVQVAEHAENRTAMSPGSAVVFETGDTLERDDTPAVGAERP
ncbi:MAG TPA: Fe-S protein assembly chaperone HscA [Polyangiaceae bacterium]|jgi:molecular chaperone HscA|nr:Fe-S protein assembly chaperone HscA [Polyangiaceae bacterium]